jgi:small conductance mechanosensitive channel
MDIFDTLANIRIGSLSLSAILYAIVVYIVCLITIRIVKRLLARIEQKSKLDKALVKFITSIATAAMWAVACIIIAGTLGIPTASLVALLSVVGLALSLSVQGLASNLFSGATILATKPFTIGDFVELGGISGTIEKIGLFHTLVLTVDNRRVFIPNSDVTGSKISNYSACELRRVDLTFSAAYDFSTEQVKTALFDAIDAVPTALRDPAPEAHLSAYKDSNIEYVLRVWTKNADYWATYFGLNEAVRESFAKAGVAPSFNRVDVSAIK